MSNRTEDLGLNLQTLRHYTINLTSKSRHARLIMSQHHVNWSCGHLILTAALEMSCSELIQCQTTETEMQH